MSVLLRRYFQILNHHLQPSTPDVSEITVANSVASKSLMPNTLYIFTTRTSALTLTLGTPITGYANEYHLLLTTGSSAPTITWPTYNSAALKWNGGSAPTIAASKTYEVSILNGVATFIEV